MGTLLAQAIADRAWSILLDTPTTGGRWPAAEVLQAINDGQREIVLVMPSAYTKTAKGTLVNDTRQTLDGMGITDGTQLLKMTRNYSANGETVGPPITRIDMAVIDQEVPTWHTDTATAVTHYMTDPQDPKAAYVWKKVITSTKVEVVYAAVPAEVAAIGNAITLDDIYFNPLLNFVLSRLLSKRVAGIASAKQEAVGYYNLMLQQLGIRDRVILAADQAETAAGSKA